MTHEKITINAIVNAPVEQVWRCWNAPEHITQWNFASDDWCCPRAENDVQVGGAYRSRMEARDGSFGFDLEYIYDDVVEYERLAYTMPDGRTVRTTFEAQGAATLVTTVFDAETMNSPEMQKNGWQAILNNFKTHTEAQ